jgi:hypothetical protein
MKEREAFTEREFLDFARSYLSDAFPNSERTGCPADDALRQLARHPLQSNLSLADHLTCCSPCFKVYMQHLGKFRAELVQEQRSHQAIWIRRSAASVAIAAALVTAFYLLFPRRHYDHIIIAPHTPASATFGCAPQAPAVALYAPVVIDLSLAAQRRGAKPGGDHAAAQVIPAHSLVGLTLRLPVGSEKGLYSITLASHEKNVWSGSAEASRENSQIMLRTRADFTQVPAGDYTLQVTTAGMRLAVPLTLK